MSYTIHSTTEGFVVTQHGIVDLQLGMPILTPVPEIIALWREAINRGDAEKYRVSVNHISETPDYSAKDFLAGRKGMVPESIHYGLLSFFGECNRAGKEITTEDFITKFRQLLCTGSRSCEVTVTPEGVRIEKIL